MSSIDNIASTNTQKVSVERKPKELTYGISKPLNVKWTGDTVVGEYITVVVAHSMSRTPVEFVVSKHIGKSLTISKDTVVINNRKDVPELIQEAGDPLKKRYEVIIREMKMKRATDEGLLIQVGEKFLLTQKASDTLAGQDVEKYLERSIGLFNAAKENAKKKHEMDEKGKPFRMKQRFIFDKRVEDFYTKEEKAVQVLLSNTWKEPGFVALCEQATESHHETLVDGTRNQTKIQLRKEGWEYMPMSHLVTEIGKEIRDSLIGKLDGKPVSETVQRLEEQIALLKKEKEKFDQKIKNIHDYYASNDLYRMETSTKIQQQQETIEELMEENQQLKDELESTAGGQ